MKSSLNNENIRRKKVVMAFGTFDIFHQGHANFLQQAREQGDYLIVVVARDVNVKKIKGTLPMHNELQRLQFVQQSGLADETVLGEQVVRYEIIKKIRPDVICLGYDQNAFLVGFRQRLDDMGLKGTKIVRLKAFRPNVYKSSKLRNVT